MPQSPPENQPPRLARALYARAAIACLTIVLCCAAAVSTAALLEVKDDVQKALPASSQLPQSVRNQLDSVDPGGPQTLLLLGSDQRYVDRINHTPTRSDTMILVRLDPSKGATAVMNIPRDLRVTIPGHGSDKINAAYAIGGPALTLKTIRALLSQGAPDGHFPINHTVNINFGGFRRAVDRLGCVYVDVDRKYFNDNNPPAGGGGDYATIDVNAGYQKLCGQNALDYVRYRHFDSDLVRAARQQDFLRQAKDQIGLGKLFGDRKALLKIFGRYTQTDIHGTTAVLRLIKLMIDSAKNPIQEVHFEADPAGNDLTITPQNLRRDVTRFLDAKGSGARGKAKKTSSDKRRERRQRRGKQSGVPVGLFDARGTASDLGVQLGVKLQFPVYYPRYAALGSVYKPNDSRVYDVYDRGHNKYRAYRMVVSSPGIGQYYGVEGMTWRDPPILDDPSETRSYDGRKYDLYFDGQRLRLIAWRTPRAVYWVSNTLLLSLTNKQMIGIARSLQRVGS